MLGEFRYSSFNYYDQKVEHKNPADAYKSKIVHISIWLRVQDDYFKIYS